MLLYFIDRKKTFLPPPEVLRVSPTPSPFPAIFHVLHFWIKNSIYKLEKRFFFGGGRAGKTGLLLSRWVGHGMYARIYMHVYARDVFAMFLAEVFFFRLFLGFKSKFNLTVRVLAARLVCGQ